MLRKVVVLKLRYFVCHTPLSGLNSYCHTCLFLYHHLPVTILICPLPRCVLPSLPHTSTYVPQALLNLAILCSHPSKDLLLIKFIILIHPFIQYLHCWDFRSIWCYYCPLSYEPGPLKQQTTATAANPYTHACTHTHTHTEPKDRESVSSKGKTVLQQMSPCQRANWAHKPDS